MRDFIIIFTCGLFPIIVALLLFYFGFDESYREYSQKVEKLLEDFFKRYWGGLIWNYLKCMLLMIL